MGFFDRLLGKKTNSASAGAPAPAGTAAGDLARAVEHLAAGQLAEAVSLYEQVLQQPGLPGATLAAISAELGARGHLEPLVTLIAPVYDPAVHDAEPGLNLLQAYLQQGNVDAAQQLLDVLAALDRPDLAERLAGFGAAVSELRSRPAGTVLRNAAPGVPQVQLVTLSRPVWSYGLDEPAGVLPVKEGLTRSMACLPLAAHDDDGKPLPPDHPAAVWARAWPFALAEALAFAPRWQARAVTGLEQGGKLFVPPQPFTAQQVKHLFGDENQGTDYAVGGAIAVGGEGFAIALEVFEAPKGRAMRQFRAEGTLAGAPAVLGAVFGQWRQYCEAATVVPGGLAYAPPEDLPGHLAALEHLLLFFLAHKQVRPLQPGDEAEERLAALEARAGDPLGAVLLEAARTLRGGPAAR